MSPALSPTLDQLRRVVADIDPSRASLEGVGSLRLGVPALDAVLQGGLACGALHEFAPASPVQLGAASGFALAIASLAAAAASAPDRFGGLGHTAFDLILDRNRRGRCGRWTLGWNHHERIFQTLSLGLAAAARDRSDDAMLARTA